MKIVLAALAAVLLLPGCVNTSKQNKPLVALKKAPEFTLKNVLGGELKSDDFKGKVLVVDFWATWCVPCKKEIPEYNELRRKYKDQGVEFLGVTFDSSEKQFKQFVEETRIDYPVVWGTDAVDAAFGGHPGLPTTFLIGRDWKIYRKIFGNTGSKIEMMEKDILVLLERPAEAPEQAAQPEPGVSATSSTPKPLTEQR